MNEMIKKFFLYFINSCMYFSLLVGGLFSYWAYERNKLPYQNMKYFDSENSIVYKEDTIIAFSFAAIVCFMLSVLFFGVRWFLLRKKREQRDG